MCSCVINASLHKWKSSFLSTFTNFLPFFRPPFLQLCYFYPFTPFVCDFLPFYIYCRFINLHKQWKVRDEGCAYMGKSQIIIITTSLPIPKRDILLNLVLRGKFTTFFHELWDQFTVRKDKKLIKLGK